MLQAGVEGVGYLIVVRVESEVVDHVREQVSSPGLDPWYTHTHCKYQTPCTARAHRYICSASTKPNAKANTKKNKEEKSGKTSFS